MESYFNILNESGTRNTLNSGISRNFRKLILLIFRVAPRIIRVHPRSVLFCLFLITVIYGCGKETAENTNKEIKYTAYYFHPTARCEECLNLEAFLKELIETKYTDKGIEFKTINTEEKENMNIKNKYEIMASSVVLTEINSDKWKKLDSVWSFTHDKVNFFRYTENEINNFINQK